MRYVLLLVLLTTPLAAQSIPRWEYGVLSQSFRGNPMTWRWRGGDTTLTLDVKQDLPYYPDDPPHGTAVRRADPSIAFVNRLGRDGWELVSVMLTGGDEMAWFFKRPLSRSP